MKRRLQIAIAIVVLLSVPGFAMAAVTGSPDLSVHISDNSLVPGEETTLDVVLLNEGEVESGSATNPSLASEVTTAKGVTVALNSDDAPFEVKTSRQPVGNVPEGTSPPVSFRVVVPEDAESGTYRIPVRIGYSYTDYISEGDTNRDQSDVRRTEHVSVTVEDRARFDVVNVSSDVGVGSSGTVSVTVENDGSMTARETQLSLASSSADLTFGGAQEGTRSAGRMEPGEQRTLNYSVAASADADTSSYPLTLTADYKDGDGQQYTTSGTRLTVTPEPEQTFAVGQVESTLAVGDDGELSGVLTNTGPSDADDVVLTWASEQQNVNPTETEYAIGALEAGESAEFEFDVEVSDAARSGPRQFSLVAEFENDQGDDRTTDPLTVRQEVADASDEFEVDIVNANVSAGGSSTIELELTNTAGEELTDISAALFADSPISADDDEEYVQSLEPGESETLVFGISAGGGALEKEYPLSMDFQYDEPDGDTVTSDTYRVPVQVTTPDGGGSPLALIGGAVLLVIVAVGAFMRFR
ncbi:COG1361 S-layer family protein [Halobacteria archaeon HArc-gm2]|nr:COG1361 S-layer family protein [Halobacteria archaeon HArc-gm2]